MNNTAVRTRRKNIDIREDVYRFLSIKAAASAKEASGDSVSSTYRSSMTACSSSTLFLEVKPMTRNTRRN